jgi:tRNA threonylcarbamoyladenosine biosynthesis protein TsaE
MVTLTSHNPAETEALGEAWGKAAQRGWVIGLTGDLGAGKTQLVKGLARGLGSPDLVHSPTFALMHEYRGGRLPLFHLDFYRLETPEQIRGAGLEEFLLEPPGVSVVEWIERWRHSPEWIGCQATLYRQVHFETLDEKERRIRYEDFGG